MGSQYSTPTSTPQQVEETRSSSLTPTSDPQQVDGTRPSSSTRHRALLIFGGYAKDPTNTRDVDAIYVGMTKEEANRELLAHLEKDPNFKGKPIDLLQGSIASDNNTGEHKVYIPTAGKQPLHTKVVTSSVPLTPLPSKFEDNPSSIIRGQFTAEEMAERLDRRNLSINLEEKMPDSTTHPCHEYENGRLSIVNAVERHIQPEVFQRATELSQWGGVLRRLSRERPDPTFVTKVRSASSGWAGRVFIVKCPNNQDEICFTVQHANWLWTVAELEKELYPSS